MQNKKVRALFPRFYGCDVRCVLEIIATLVDEIVVGNLFDDCAFASVNLIEPYTLFEVFIAYLVAVGAAALIVRAHGAGDHKKMSEVFSQTIIVCGLGGIGLALIYVIFTPQLVRFVADDPAVYDNALDYFRIMRFYPLVDMFDTFMFTYVLYRGGLYILYRNLCPNRIKRALSWFLGSQMGLGVSVLRRFCRFLLRL
jgi:Na+-driven multidrug efflux pump